MRVTITRVAAAAVALLSLHRLLRPAGLIDEFMAALGDEKSQVSVRNAQQRRHRRQATPSNQVRWGANHGSWQELAFHEIDPPGLTVHDINIMTTDQIISATYGDG